jgi:hypothetical protein
MFKNIYDLREGEVVYYLSVPYGADNYRVKKCTVKKIDYSKTGKNLLRIQLLTPSLYMRDYGDSIWVNFSMEKINEFVFRNEDEAKKMADAKNFRDRWGL